MGNNLPNAVIRCSRLCRLSAPYSGKSPRQNSPASSLARSALEIYDAGFSMQCRCRMNTQIPRAWLDELNDHCVPGHRPDGQAAVLSALATDTHRCRKVDADQKCEMLEFAEADQL